MNKIIISIVVLILILSAVFAFWYRSERAAMLAVRTFEDCAQNGFPVMESYPRQCRTPDGRSFTEEIKEEPKQPTILAGEAFVQKYPLTSNIAVEQVIKSPLVVEGEAWGPWFFEATFGIKILDGAGKEVVTAPAMTTEENWMTEGKVPFKATITFATPATATGTMVFMKDNPSGLPEYDAEYRVPVRFK